MLYLYFYLLVVAITVLHITVMYKKEKYEHKKFLQDLENKTYRKRDEAWMYYRDFI